MGFLSELAKGGRHKSTFVLGREQGLATWREVFGRTDKERVVSAPKSPDGGSFVRSVASEAGIKRLLEALRSRAPGGWTDNRYEQSGHFVGIAYVAIHRLCEQLSQAEFQVFQKDSSHPDGKVPARTEGAEKLIRLLEKPNEEDSFGELMYCLPSGTLIRMGDGSWKPIEKIQLLDEVFTATGSVRKVRQLHTHKEGESLFEVRLWGHRHLRMTAGHKVLTKRGFVRADELTSDDYVSLPRCPVADRTRFVQTAAHVQGEVVRTKEWHPERSYGREAKEEFGTGGVPWANYKKVPDFIELTPGVGRLLGLFLAEGHLEKSGIAWSFGTHEKDTLVADTVRLLKEEFGLDAKTYVLNKRGSVTQVKVNGKLWARLFRSLCGEKSYGKRLHPDLANGPDDFLTALYRGWQDGDGCEDRKGRTKTVTVSHELAIGMYDIANRLGWRPALLRNPPQKHKQGGKWNIKSSRPTWSLYLKSFKDNWRVSLDEGTTWRRVEGVGKVAFSGDVFDIGVEEEHSYIAEGVAVHNSWHQQMSLTGSALTWVVPNALGTPYELYPIETAIAVPGPILSEEYPKGYYQIQPIYPYGPFSSFPTPLSAVGARIPAEWMMRFKYKHPLIRYEGYSPLTALRLHLDEVEAMDRSRWYSMKRTFRPNMVLNMADMEGAQPMPQEEIERIKVEIENAFMGPENAGNLFIPAPGTKLEEFGTVPRDMDYQSGWEQLVSFCLGGLGITKPAAGMIEDASYSTLFATLKQLYWLTLEPAVNRLSSKLTRCLAPFFGDDLIVEVRCKRIDDHEVKFQAVDKLLQAKAITKNEMRRELGMPLTKEEWGNEIAGFEEPPVPPGMGMPGVEAGSPEGAGEEESDNPLQDLQDVLDGGDEADTENSRPNPEGAARGSLGTRPPREKALYDKVLKVMRNGHAKRF